MRCMGTIMTRPPILPLLPLARSKTVLTTMSVPQIPHSSMSLSRLTLPEEMVMGMVAVVAADRAPAVPVAADRVRVVPVVADRAPAVPVVVAAAVAGVYLSARVELPIQI